MKISKIKALLMTAILATATLTTAHQPNSAGALADEDGRLNGVALGLHDGWGVSLQQTGDDAKDLKVGVARSIAALPTPIGDVGIVAGIAYDMAVPVKNDKWHLNTGVSIPIGETPWSVAAVYSRPLATPLKVSGGGWTFGLSRRF